MKPQTSCRLLLMFSAVLWVASLAWLVLARDGGQDELRIPLEGIQSCVCAPDPSASSVTFRMTVPDLWSAECHFEKGVEP